MMPEDFRRFIIAGIVALWIGIGAMLIGDFFFGASMFLCAGVLGQGCIDEFERRKMIKRIGSQK